VFGVQCFRFADHPQGFDTHQRVDPTPTTYQAIGVPVAWVITVAALKTPSRYAWWVRFGLLALMTRIASDVARHVITTDSLLLQSATALSAILPFLIVAGDRLTVAWLRRRSGAESDYNSTTSTT